MTPYHLLRSARKTVALEITREGEVLVRAPLRMAKAQIDAFVAGHEQWISTHLARRQQQLAAHPEPDDAKKAALIRAAKEILPGKVAHYAARMGVQPTGITVTAAATRFGSCSSKGRLSFSWRLMDYPEDAIDYVVVHELAHLLHMDHSRRFYAVVESILPDWKRRRALLKE